MWKVFFHIFMFFSVLFVNIENPPYKCYELRKPVQIKHIRTVPSFMKNSSKSWQDFVNQFNGIVQASQHLNQTETHSLQGPAVYHKIFHDETISPSYQIVDYQAEYVYVYEGIAEVKIEIESCGVLNMVDAGFVIRGWNIITLDFPALLEKMCCLTWSKDSLVQIHFNGTARFSTWNISNTHHVKVPQSPTVLRAPECCLIIFGLLAIVQSLSDIYYKFNAYRAGNCHNH